MYAERCFIINTFNIYASSMSPELMKRITDISPQRTILFTETSTFAKQEKLHIYRLSFNNVFSLHFNMENKLARAGWRKIKWWRLQITDFRNFMVKRENGWQGVLNDTCEQARQQVMGRMLRLKKRFQCGDTDHLFKNIVQGYFLKPLRNSQNFLPTRYWVFIQSGIINAKKITSQ